MAKRFTNRLLLLKIIFPLIYAVFFFVQIFINFDSAFTQNSDRYQVVQCQYSGKHQIAFQSSKSNQPVKTKFRLNKRFQPAVFSLLPEIKYLADLPSVTIPPIRYMNPVLSNPLPNTRLLRGPPFVA